MSRIVIVTGPDAFQLESYIEERIGAALSLEEQAWNVAHLSDMPALGELLSQADGLPFLAPRRITWVRRAPLVLRKNKGGGLDEEQKILLNYAKTADVTNWLFLEAVGDLTPGAFLKKMSGVAEVIALRPPKDRDLIAWAQKRLQKDGKTLSRDAEFLLLEEHYRSLSEWDQAFEKAVLFQKDRPVIDRTTLKQVLPPHIEESVFRLMDGLFGGKADIFSIYRELLQMNETPQGLMYRLIDQVKTILMAAALARSGHGEKDIAARLGKHPYVVKKSLAEAKRHSVSVLQHVLLFLADEMVRFRQSGAVSDEVHFEEVLLGTMARLSQKK